jgi:hypothetical protein
MNCTVAGTAERDMFERARDAGAKVSVLCPGRCKLAGGRGGDTPRATYIGE